MRRIARLIFNRWVLLGVGLLAGALLIWWVGPEISISNVRPFETETVRWIQIAVLVLAPVGRIGWKLFKSRRASAALIDGLVQPPAKAQAPKDPSAAEVAQLRQRFEEALGLLRKRHAGGAKPSLWSQIRSLGSRQYLYDLPWYVFIGAPGSGKTTALVNSGLRFPLATRLGQESVRGVGGTRDCDWWFTDEAVFLDTAGRYTTQQSQRDLDAGAWNGFLKLLKKSRPRRPINGVLLTVSVGDLLQESPAEREAHTEAIRARVHELYQELGVRFPIYVLVTKSDLLAGFSEFFADLGKDERGQVWGFSLTYGEQGLDPDVLARELERLEARLYDRLPERLEEEREPARRALLYGFPQQFALLRGRLVDFVESTFTPTRFEVAGLLRGIYFTSGTQEGSAIDRVMGAFARDMGLERKLLPAQRPSGRSYFLTRLLREVVFPEAGLAGTDLRRERRRQLIQSGAIAAAVVGLAVVSAAWWMSYSRNQRYLAEIAAELPNVQGLVGDAQAGILPKLTGVRTLAETRATPDGSVPWSWRLGLYQGPKLEAASQAAYQRMLREAFLPAMAQFLEQDLRRDQSYDSLRTYVMLYDPKRFNRETVWRWYEARRDRLFPGASPEEQNVLKAHYDTLYERGWVDPPRPRDDQLVARVQSLIGQDSLPKRTYDRLRRQSVSDLRDFTVAEQGGPRAMLVFTRASRAPLTSGVPALYTKDGYYKSFVKRLDPTVLRLAEEEAWVLGSGTSGIAQAASSPALVDAVRRLYLEDYRRIWRQFIDDIVLVTDRDLTRIIEVTRTLSGPDNPLKPLVKAIDRETTLSVPPDAEPGVTGAVGEKVRQLTDQARGAISGGAPDALVKSMVDNQFEDVHRLAGPPGGTGPAPIDATIQQLNDFYQFLVAADIALKMAQTPPAADSANKLRAEVARLPEPLRSMLQGLVERGSGQITERVRQRQVEDLKLEREKQASDARAAREKQAEEQRLAGEKRAEERRSAHEKQAEDAKVAREKQLADTRHTRDRIDAELRAQVADFCVKAVSGRYPFVRASAQDVTAEDFARLFAPSGLLDGFFQKHLAAHVDTTVSPWRFRDVAMGQSGTLVEFQRAQVIRDVFFRGGGATPSIQLEFKPMEMDASIHQFLLDVDGKVVRYAHGPQIPVRVQFPGPSGRSQVRASISPPPPSGSNAMKFEGPWALFRMFDGVKFEETKQLERFIAAISLEGRRTVFEISASSVRNPFRLPELSQFRCPTAL